MLKSQDTFSQHGFSNDSSQNYCQKCSNYQLILEQLHRVRQAIEIKNKRIEDLQVFIQKISKMAFMDSISSQMKSQFQTQNTLKGISNNSIYKKDSRPNQILSQAKKQSIDVQEISFRKTQFPSDLISCESSFKQNFNKKMSIYANYQKEQKSNNNYKGNFNSIMSRESERESQSYQNFNNPTKLQQRQSRIKEIMQANLKKRWLQSRFQSIATESQPHQEGVIGSIKGSQNEMYSQDQQLTRSHLPSQNTRLDENSKNMLKLQIQRLK